MIASNILLSISEFVEWHDRNFKCRMSTIGICPFFQPNPRKLLSGAVSSLTDNDGTIDPKNFATIRTTSIVQRQQKEHLQVSKRKKKSRQMATSKILQFLVYLFLRIRGVSFLIVVFWEAKIKKKFPMDFDSFIHVFFTRRILSTIIAKSQNYISCIPKDQPWVRIK